MNITNRQKEINKIIDFLTEFIYQIDNAIDEYDDYQTFFGDLYDFLNEHNIELSYYSLITDYIREITPQMDIVNVNALTNELELLIPRCNRCEDIKKKITNKEITKLKTKIKNAKTKVLKRK